MTLQRKQVTGPSGSGKPVVVSANHQKAKKITENIGKSFAFSISKTFPIHFENHNLGNGIQHFFKLISNLFNILFHRTVFQNTKKLNMYHHVLSRNLKQNSSKTNPRKNSGIFRNIIKTKPRRPGTNTNLWKTKSLQIFVHF